MGNSNRSPEDYEIVTKYRQQDWMHESNEEGIQIWRNRFTNEAAEVYQLYGVPSIEDMDIYTTRTMENDLIKVHCLAIESNKDMCSINRFAQLLVEHIPIKLNNIHNFDRQEALTVLSAAFRGFHLLEIKFGAIVPSEEHIGFNEHGKTKIWLNRNTYYNYADKRAILNEQLPQISIVSNRVKILFQMIEERTRYLLVPSIIKEQIYNPFTTYLSALKVLEKFAYFQKLNLRKYLQFFQNREKQPQSTKLTQQNHTRNPSTVTENKQNRQMCFYQNESISNVSRMKNSIQLRRIYSLNNIHNQSNSISILVPPVDVPQILRGEQKSQKQSLVKHSIMSNNSSFIQPVHPSSVNLKQSNHKLNIFTINQVKNNYIRGDHMNQSKSVELRAQNIPKSQVKIQKIGEKHLDHESIKQSNDLLGEVNHLKEQAINQQLKLAIKDSGQVLELRDISQNQQQLKVMNKIENLLEDSQDEQFQSNRECKFQEALNQPSSPTFVYFPEIKCELISFAPSQQNLPQSDDAQNKNFIKQNSLAHKNQIQFSTLCHKMKQGGYLKGQSNKYYDTNKNQEQIDEQRRLSIQNKTSKLQFLPEFVLNSENLLNLCTQVESKLHMATNREHSIIQPEVKHEISIHLNKSQNEQSQRYNREKYSKIPRQKGKHRQQQTFKTKIIENKYVTQSQKFSITSNIKNPINYQYQKSLTNFGGEEDFLDVNFLEKSLDKRYSNIQHQLKLEQNKKQIEENDTLNIAKLEEGMLKFSNSQLNQKNISPNIKYNDSISKNIQYIGALQKDQPLEDIGSSHHVKQYSTGFEKKYPFQQKKFNEQKYQKNIYLPQKSLKHQSFQRRVSKFQPQDNKKQFSFEGNSRSLYSDPQDSYEKPITRSYYIKQIQLSDQNHKSKLRSNQGIEQLREFIPFDGRDQIYKETLEEEQKNYQKDSSQLKGAPTKKISYEQLRQFLWN